VPNYLTGLSTKLFEYMAAGLPVIASDFPLWKGFVEGNDCGVCVNPLDTEEIARAIEYLMDHPDRRRKMGENGRNVVLEKYSWERESAHLLQIYDEMLGG
jgi:glycosyltransferase involved in cell wall biosynthesis